jgi:hypothetical protein
MGAFTINSLSDPEFAHLFRDFTRSAFRLETLQAYDVAYEAPALEAFRAGRPLPPDPGAKDWTERIRAHVAAGRTFRRVHVVVEPLSEYLRFELVHGYAAGVAGGEEIRIAVAGTAAADELPGEDFWLFDEQVAVVMDYGSGGEFLRARILDDPAEVAQRVRWQRAAWAGGLALDAYLASYGLSPPGPP